MKTLLILIIFSVSSFAQQQKTTLPNSDDMLMENLRNVKNQEVDKYLLENPATKECQTKVIKDDTDYLDSSKRKDVRSCFSNKLDELPDETIQKLSDDLNLKGYGVIKDNSVPVVKNYFDERLEQALYGKVSEADKNKNSLLNVTKQRFVDHETFLDLYNSQLGKNSLLKISEFCLKYTFNPSKTDCNTDPQDIKYISCFDIKEDKDLVGVEVKKLIQNNKDQVTIQGPNGPIQTSKFHKEWMECTNALPKLCELYTKKQVSNDFTVSGSESAEVSSLPEEQKLMLRHSCKIVKYMKDYRDVIVEINEQKKELKDLKGKGGINLGGTFKDVYGSSSSDIETIDKITTVSSNDVADSYDDKNVNQDAEECATSANPESDACKKFFSVKKDYEPEKLILDYELKSMAQVKLFNDKIKDLDEKGLEDYLRDQGNEKMIEELKAQGEEAIKQKMYEQFKAERMAIVNDLYARIKAREITQQEKDSQSINQKLNQVKDDVINTKEKIRGLYHYTNIVTSYLTLNDKDGNVISSNNVGLLTEQEKYQGDDAQAYFQDLKPNDINSTQTANKKGNESTVVDLGFIDTFLQSKIEEKTNQN